jgi:hypothetical protein
VLPLLKPESQHTEHAHGKGDFLLPGWLADGT